MQLEHSFTVPVGVEEAWRVLLDIERVAPCMPGASLDSVDGDNFTGTVKVKVGPIGLTYKGKASFVEKDEAAHRAVIDAQGKDARGNGTASAKVAATLKGEGESTRVDVVTDLNITGKPAQFGRGVMVDVGNKLIGQFADCLAGKLADGSGSSSVAPSASSASSGSSASSVASSGSAGSAGSDAAGDSAAVRPVAPRYAASSGADGAVEPINLVASAGPAVAKRVVPVALVLVIVLLVLRRWRSS
jgi:carbon monoxide dehydrogenase subunit G